MRIIIINSFALVGSEAEDGDDQQAGEEGGDVEEADEADQPPRQPLSLQM